MTVAKVLDASAFAAIAFQEAEERDVLARILNCDLHAPLLIRYELANVCLKKIRKRCGDEALLLAQHRSSVLVTIREHPVDQDAVVALANTLNLSSYDASYLWLARHLNVELVTLDERLQKAAVTS